MTAIAGEPGQDWPGDLFNPSLASQKSQFFSPWTRNTFMAETEQRRRNDPMAADMRYAAGQVIGGAFNSLSDLAYCRSLLIYFGIRRAPEVYQCVQESVDLF